jgi:hypothetical protein
MDSEAVAGMLWRAADEHNWLRENCCGIEPLTDFKNAYSSLRVK